jgi:hypothetical protein
MLRAALVHVIAAAWLRLAIADNTTWLTLSDDRYYGLVWAVGAYISVILPNIAECTDVTCQGTSTVLTTLLLLGSCCRIVASTNTLHPSLYPINTILVSVVGNTNTCSSYICTVQSKNQITVNRLLNSGYD